MNSIAQHILIAHSRIAHSYAGGVGSGIWYYKDSSKAYLRWQYRMIDKILSSMVSAMQLSPEARFLDGGCGNGQWMEYFAKRHGFCNFIAVDFSRPMLECAKQRMSGLPLSVDYVEANLESLQNVQRDSVDIIHMFGVMEHLDRPKAVLDECHRVLKKQGYLILVCPIQYSLYHLSFMLLGLSPEHWGLELSLRLLLDFRSKAKHYRFYTRKYYEDRLSDRFLILQRHNTTFGYGVSYLGLPHRWLPAISHSAQDFYERVCQLLYFNRPAVIYYLAQKM